MKALVLSGGGARGAYQVGVLQAVGELIAENKLPNPFGIYCGVSAGSINASFMASTCEHFYQGAEGLANLWGDLTSDRVFRTDALSLGKIGFQWIEGLSLGALAGPRPGISLLDTSPLAKLISQNLQFSKIQENINNHTFKALVLTALDYRTSETISFLQCDPEIKNWERARRKSEKAFIQTEHIMASSAIPILFPPVAVGNRYFGDGCVRNHAPLSPAVHLGATELLVVGVRKKAELYPEPLDHNPQAPSLARVANAVLNSVLLDSIEVDLDRLEKINEFVRRVPKDHQTNLNFKPIKYLFISPTKDIGHIAFQMSSRLPRIIRYLLKGLGPLEDAREIISYLMFEKEFLGALMEMGYDDGMAQKENILRFLLESQPQSLDWEGF
jgi:NTE family protein